MKIPVLHWILFIIAVLLAYCLAGLIAYYSILELLGYL